MTYRRRDGQRGVLQVVAGTTTVRTAPVCPLGGSAGRGWRLAGSSLHSPVRPCSCPTGVVGAAAESEESGETTIATNRKTRALTITPSGSTPALGTSGDHVLRGREGLLPEPVWAICLPIRTIRSPFLANRCKPRPAALQTRLSGPPSSGGVAWYRFGEFMLAGYRAPVHRFQSACPVCGAPRQRLVLLVQPTVDEPESEPIRYDFCSSLICPTNLRVLTA